MLLEIPFILQRQKAHDLIIIRDFLMTFLLAIEHMTHYEFFHADLNWRNIIIENGYAVFIDWERIYKEPVSSIQIIIQTLTPRLKNSKLNTIESAITDLDLDAENFDRSNIQKLSSKLQEMIISKKLNDELTEILSNHLLPKGQEERILFIRQSKTLHPQTSITLIQTETQAIKKFATETATTQTNKKLSSHSCHLL